MISRHDLLYDLSGGKFERSEHRFRRRAVPAVLGEAKLESANHATDSKAFKGVAKGIDALCAEDHFVHVPSFNAQGVADDLNIEQVVQHILRPRFSPTFQYAALLTPPVNLDTVHYRQEGMRELITNPEMATGLEDAMDQYMQLVCAVMDRAAALVELNRRWMIPRRTVLKELNKYNLRVLQRYIAAVNKFEFELRDAHSGPMRNLQAYFQEVKKGKFWNDISPTFDIEYFKDYRIRMEASIARDGRYNGVIYRGSEGDTSIPSWRFFRDSLGMTKAFFKMLSLPSTFAMDATNQVVQDNLDELMKMVEVVGQLEFYTCGAGFHRRMEDIGMPVVLPKVLPKEERRCNVVQARNPLLLYQEGADPRDVNRVIPNNIIYDAENNIFVITGSNNGGKTLHIKTVGLTQLMAQSGLPITAEGQPEISMVDGIYSHFVTADDIMAGEGRLKNELRRVMGIFDKATPYSIMLLDEPTGGTSPEEGVNTLAVILDGLHRLGAPTWLTTHLYELAGMVDNGRYSAGSNWHVEVLDDPESGRKIRTYRVLPEAATSSYGSEIARQVGLTGEDLLVRIEERVQRGALPREELREVYRGESQD
ncbi:hypothetical protein ACFL0V_04095 [Nanoarchaeota archaeon]